MHSSQKNLNCFGNGDVISQELLLDEHNSGWCSNNRNGIQNPTSEIIMLVSTLHRKVYINMFALNTEKEAIHTCILVWP